jgi:hypothetical protein
MPDKDPASGFVNSLPPMRLVTRAAEGGDLVMRLLQRMIGQGGKPGNVGRPTPYDTLPEPERREYFNQQGVLGQQMRNANAPNARRVAGSPAGGPGASVTAPKPLQAPSPK